ncbi:hypothetical protein JCM8547_000500 [Rhodosporidiobolus lusitaniae]
MASASPVPMAGWTKHTSPDGRPYWSKNGQSVWEKPDELKTPAEREMASTGWKEYETGGRKYWVKGSETTWNMPKELSDIAARYAAPPVRPGLPTGPSSFGHSQSPMQHPHPGGQISGSPLTPHSGALAVSGGFSPAGLPARPTAAALPPAPVPSSLIAATTTVSFATHAEAEAAFKSMLKELGVDSTWTWEQVMKEAITEPMYKALKTLQERKDAFQKYLEETRKEEAEERDKSLTRCRKEWHKVMEKLNGGVNMEEGVKSWWSWERGRRVLKEKVPEVWAGPRNDEERKILFDEFIHKLRTTEETRMREMRGRNMDKLTAILQTLQLDLAGPIRWQDVRAMFYRTPEWHRDPELQRIEPIDMLTVFEDEVRRAEKELAEQRQRVAEDKRRRARRARDDFNALLHDLVQSGQITSGTTWKSIYPLFAHDERYLAVLGAQGSSPLELFWDLVDELDVRAEEDQHVVELVAREKGLTVDEKTTEEEYVATLKGDERLANMPSSAIRATFDRLHSRAVRAAKDERRRAEKKLRLLIDDLRYAYKKIDPPVDIEKSYEEILSLIQDSPEFLALEGNEEAARTAFEKFVKRQKEKRAEREAAEAERLEREKLRAEREERRRREFGDEYEQEFGAGAEGGKSGREEEGERGEGRRRRHSSAGAGGEERKRRTSGAGLDYGGAEEGRESKVPRLERQEDGKEDVVMKPIPSSSSATSSSDSQSPVLSSSPLDSFSSIHRALPSSNSGSYREREESYDSMADVLASEEEPQRRHSMDDSDDALKQYKQGLYMYTSSRFDRFKDDLERKKRSGSSPNGVQRRSSSQ